MKTMLAMVLVMGSISATFANTNTDSNVLFVGKDGEKECRVLILNSSDDGEKIKVRFIEGSTKIDVNLALKRNSDIFEGSQFGKGYFGHMVNRGYTSSLATDYSRFFLYYKPAFSGAFIKTKTFECINNE